MSENNEKIEKLQKMIDESERIVFFGGAGVSTESGVPDFRSENGLYNQKYDYGYPPETMLSHTFWVAHRKDFFRFYYERILLEEVDTPSGKKKIEPNAAHIFLAKLEEAGKLSAVVTQNIDGLHQKAGNKKVYELHGTVMRNFCTKCHEMYDVDWMMDQKHKGIYEPVCDKCGAPVKPDVVLYEEGLDDDTVEGAVNAIRDADMLIIGGTSLVVYPAAGFVNYYRGNRLVLINKSLTGREAEADLVINDSIGQVFSQIHIN